MSDVDTQNEGAYLRSTLDEIDELANEDVDMQAPLSELNTFLVVDTNIFHHYLEALVKFVDAVERLALPTVIVIPGIVISELDRQKDRDGLSRFARKASVWILDKVKERKSVKVQANDETCKMSGNWKMQDLGEVIQNDDLIVDCAMYFRRAFSAVTYLLSKDHNLCIAGVTEEIPTITPTRNFSSRDLARIIYGDKVDLRQFEEYRPSYSATPTGSKKNEPGQAFKQRPMRCTKSTSDVDDDTMAVDEDGNAEGQSGTSLPSHPLDLFHLQVVEHFSKLLVELVGRVRGSNERSDLSTSQHAPERWRAGVPHTLWSATECLSYLDSKRPVEECNPRVGVFLSKPYTCRGARRGQDWSRKDWEVALTGLARTGDLWNDVSIRESLAEMEPQLERVFALRLRPTGI